MKNALFLCTGNSGSGKNYFIRNKLPAGLFHTLVVAATRQPRPSEQEGIDRYFVNEDYFYENKFATWSWVNEFLWKPGEPKWMYGVPEFEVRKNLGKNLVYEVIEPKYARQMIDWFHKNKLTRDYDIKTIWFLDPENKMDTIRRRANMPNDEQVRLNNTCQAIDFLRAGLHPDFMIKSTAQEYLIDPRLLRYINNLNRQKEK